MQESNVKYSINGNDHDLVDCYYCESCNRVISNEDVRVEIDTYFCPSCLENIPSSEAFLRNFRCMSCHDCPYCMATVLTNKIDLESEQSESDIRSKYSYRCGFCNFSFDTPSEMEPGSEVDLNQHDASNSLEENKLANISRSQESSYLSLITEQVYKSKIESIISVDKSDLAHSKSFDSEHTELRPSLKVLEVKRNMLTNSLQKKNLWLNCDEIKSFSSIKHSFLEYQQKNNLTYRQYLNNPDIINSVYISLRDNSHREITLTPIKKRLCVQISKRCVDCKRLVIKPQLNPLSQPPFRVNLSANLFLPNIKIISMVNNLSDDLSYSKIIKIKVENLMDRQVRVDFLPEKDQNELLSMRNSNIYSISKIEPRCLNIEPKWDPVLEQQDQQLSGLVREKRDRNKKYIDIFINESNCAHDEVELELTSVANFQSPTGNNSTVQFRIIGKANV
ncbi:putative dynactin subunit p62 [Cryptosporidium canis]|uniref:Dynactin subunit 4 n=1 Tax=Cryptosporidium canis TaxID=195482 RepID=A0ABQ8P7A6_9CRYT|nr:putative dynactin subunit p62 [Cryptosporidium canis]KAJ1610951.1 putative dynactin subunit p62 [Cryptosporidium canis]